MGELKMEDVTLPTLFSQARNIHFSASESTADQDAIRKGCEALEKCEEMVNTLGLFSANETKEDIATNNLKYILVPFYLAELTEKISQGDRIQILKSSQAKLKEFLSFCESMELVPEDELQASVQGRSNVSIARFKRQKAAEAKLLEIKERKERRGRSTRASALSSPAVDLLEMLKKEEEMLSAVRERQLKEGDKEFSQAVLDERVQKAESWHRGAATRAKHTKPTVPITCATFAQDVLEGRASVSETHDHKHQPMIFGPASLIHSRPTNERDRMAAQVFQPGHRLPTMSIEEAGMKEMEMMNKFQERNVKFMEEANSAWYKDNSIVEKARAWDDWKDENPRGAGNKKLTPCG
ncbi:PP2A regulatory subunit TAP46 [Linum grandiflorum]